jgi:transcriptional regulator with XRE-family HTH domain
MAPAGAKPVREKKPPPVPAAEVEPAEPMEAPDEVEARLAGRIAALRTERAWSLQDLARRSGVSRSTLSRVERGQISPTASVLGRLATAYDRTLSALLAEVESEPRSLVRAAEQTISGDEISGWRRRAVSPPYPGLHAQVVDVVVSPGAQAVEEPPVPGSEQHLWLLSGTLEYTPVTESGEAPTHALHTGMADLGETSPAADESLVLVRGDCLRLRAWGQVRLRCLSPDPARYALVTIPP